MQQLLLAYNDDDVDDVSAIMKWMPMTDELCSLLRINCARRMLSTVTDSEENCNYRLAQKTAHA